MTTSPLRLFSDRAASTLAGSISPTSITLNLTAGGGALFPNPNPPNFFAATLIDAATGLLDEIVWCTARTGDTITVVRGQEGTDALTFNAGDLFQKLLTSGDVESMLQSNQLFVPATQFFVNGATGSDAFTGTSSTVVAGTNIGPFATMQGAEAVIAQFFSASSVTVNVASGTYAGVAVGASLIASWIVTGSGAGTCHIVQSGAGTSAGSGFLISGANMTLTGFSVAATQAGILAQASAAVEVVNCNILTCANGLVAAAGARLGVIGAMTVNGTLGAYSTWAQAAGGSLVLSENSGFAVTPLAVSLTNVTCTNSFVSASQGGTVSANSADLTFSGTANGTRFSINFGQIQTNGGGVNFFPGTAPGTTNVGVYS